MNFTHIFFMCIPLIGCMALRISGRHQLMSTVEIRYKYEGCDPFEDEKIDDQLLMKIEDDMKRKYILKILLSDEYNIAHKMKVIQVYRYLIDKKETNHHIYVDDLLEDWNFDIK